MEWMTIQHREAGLYDDEGPIMSGSNDSDLVQDGMDKDDVGDDQ